MGETPREVRRYSRDEANALLPEVRDRVVRLRDAYAEMAGHHEKMRSLAPGNGGEGKPKDWLGSSAEFYKQLRWFEQAGIVIRKIEEGLIDFPAEREGQEIFLCWRLGEESVDHWHDTDSGFAGRQPI
jgi:hypothetical protein